jgi:LysR family hca operon transcriptional activator
MPVNAPVINTTGLLICDPRNLLPYRQSMEPDLWPRPLENRGHFSGTFVEGYVGSPGAREKDFVSWWACLGDMESAMELRHLRYFIAVAEEGSLTLAAEKRLHTAQPSLSRQIRDLEYEVGVQLMSRSVHGIELTAAGRAFLDHARLALTQAEAAKEAARRAAQPAKPTFALGFLTGKEIDWLPEAMRILHDELPNIEITVSSQNSPDLADALMRGRLDAAFMRPEEPADELVYRRVIAEPFVVIFPSDHRLAVHDAVELREIVGETFIIPSKTAPTSRAVIENYLKRSGLDIIPDHEVDNITHAVSMIASIGAVALLPAYPNNLLPWSVTSRPIRGDAPTIDLVVGYNKANKSPILKTFLSRIDDLTTRTSSKARRNR